MPPCPMAANDHTTTTTASRPAPTDPWGRPIIDGCPRFGPLDGDDSHWPAVPMLVHDDADVVRCATGFCHAFSSAYYFTVWLLVVGRDGRTTHEVVELLDMPPRPPEHGIAHLMDRVAQQFESLDAGGTLVVALAAPDGGDRGARERAWARAVLDAAETCRVGVRGVVAVGANRARLLYAGTAAGS